MILLLSVDQQKIVNTESQKLVWQGSAIDATTIRWKIIGEQASTTVVIYHTRLLANCSGENKPHLNPHNQVIRLSITNNRGCQCTPANGKQFKVYSNTVIILAQNI